MELVEEMLVDFERLTMLGIHAQEQLITMVTRFNVSPITFVEMLPEPMVIDIWFHFDKVLTIQAGVLSTLYSSNDKHGPSHEWTGSQIWKEQYCAYDVPRALESEMLR